MSEERKIKSINCDPVQYTVNGKIINESRVCFESGQWYMVHFCTNGGWVEFTVYPVIEWFDGPKSGFSYIDKENEPDTRNVFENEKCLVKMSGTYCYRGVWEGRLYFPDQEYWGNELMELAELYESELIPAMKQAIESFSHF